MTAAVTRSRAGRDAWRPKQITPAEFALEASVRSTVYEGQVADLVVVGIDPLTASGDELRAMPVAATLLDGAFTWRSL